MMTEYTRETTSNPFAGWIRHDPHGDYEKPIINIIDTAVEDTHEGTDQNFTSITTLKSEIT